MIKHIKTVQEFDETIEKGKYLVDFFATWCGPCMMLSPLLEQIENDIDILKIDTDQLPELAIRYGVSSIPNLFIFEDKKIVKHTLGYLNINELKKFIS